MTWTDEHACEGGHPTTDEERVAKALCAADSGDKYGWPYGEMARAAIAALGPRLTAGDVQEILNAAHAGALLISPQGLEALAKGEKP